jgi:hypothetical protein
MMDDQQAIEDVAFDALCERIRFACIGCTDLDIRCALVGELSEAIGRMPYAERQPELGGVLEAIAQYVSEIPPC